MSSPALKSRLQNLLGPAAVEVITTLDAVEALGGSEAAFIDGVTAGTAAASKALVLDGSLNIGTINQLTATTLIGALTGNVTGNVSGQVTFTSVARTASADGTGTGTIAAAGLIQFVAVTAGGDANSIIVLPAPTPGTIVILHVAATGYELRTSDPATIGINGGTGAGAESAIGANTTVVMICASATSWKGLQLGSDGTLAKVEVAA